MEFVNIILKTIIFYVLTIIIIRLLGKREVGEISVFDLVVLLIIADVATLAINHDWFVVLYSIASLITLLILQKLFAYITLRFPKFRKVIDYSPSIIIYDGKLNLKEMKKQSYTINDLITQARCVGVMDLNEIKLAILESNGELSIYEHEVYKDIILPIIISGLYEEENIKILNLKKEKIEKYLHDKKMKLEDVNYLSSDGNNFYMIKML